MLISYCVDSVFIDSLGSTAVALVLQVLNKPAWLLNRSKIVAQIFETKKNGIFIVETSKILHSMLVMQ